MSEGMLDQPLRGYPFIFILGIFIKLFRSMLNPIILAKLFMMACNIALVLIIYLLSRQFFNATSAFFTALFVLFQTNLILYSLVPYLEIFAYLCGFSSLYIIVSHFSELKMKFLILSMLLCIISSLTRFEMLVVFLTPTVVLLLINCAIYKNNRKFIILSIFSLSFIIFLFYPQLRSYYFGTTRFDPITRVFLAMRWKILLNTLNSILNITNDTLLNIFFNAILMHFKSYFLPLR